MAAALPVLGLGLLGSAAAKGVSSLIGGKKETPAVAAPTPIMPIADDAKVQAARKREIAAMQQRQGRASTILTNNSETLGG